MTIGNLEKNEKFKHSPTDTNTQLITPIFRWLLRDKIFAECSYFVLEYKGNDDDDYDVNNYFQLLLFC